ncbi:MAG: dTDP-4-dehydrorhamnose reductase [Chitinophagaceae bacterium]|nr:dTDP-4-dehydrorhamnose reductase [Chitinophagaceae bacterium]
MSKLKILVTGSSGQLGQSLREISSQYTAFDYYFYSRPEFALDDEQTMINVLSSVKPDFCINCAAYTAVDKAETEKETAYNINEGGVGKLALLCRQYQTKFIHISTDYVFDGNASSPYKENDPVEPVNAYGASKAEGEKLALQNNPASVIIRTSWVYSLHGKNFVKTMINLMNQKNEISVVNDQKGSPTYAIDLAQAILDIIAYKQWIPGIYHYSNKGTISWYDFAVGIQQKIKSNCTVNPIPTSYYPTPSKRPVFSVLDTSKIETTYKITIPYWKDSLDKCLNKL